MHCLAEISEEVIGELIVYPTFIFTGLLFIGLSIPLILKQIPPNSFYGWRTPKAYQNEETWYKINRYSGRDLCIIGIMQIAFNILMLIIRFFNYELVCMLMLSGNMLILIGGTIIMMVRGFIYLSNLEE